ncbi:3918_t:CDS:2 [Entrophospora sp. SA101]|nr:3918_t:CDS:2 [Entrophospora sp. SA101]
MKIITIIGSQEVGKTTLFRHLIKNSANERKGDIKSSPLINYTESLVKIGNNVYKLIDTPTFILSPKTEIEKGIKEQTEDLLKERTNIGKLIKQITTLLPHSSGEDTNQKENRSKLLIFGPPNSGKSTLMNYLLKENRSLATPIAGTTQEPEKEELKEELKSRLKSLGYVPIIYISALKGVGIKSLLKVLEKMLEQAQKKLSKKGLADTVEKMLLNNPPKNFKGNKIKIYFAKQEPGLTQSFIFFVNNPQWVHFSYQRYITNYLRKNLELDYLPLKIIFKKSV